MRAFRAVLVVAWSVLALSVLAAPAWAADTPHAVHLVKDCSLYTGNIPSVCVVSGSDLGAIPIGTEVIYQGPIVNNSYFLSSSVLLNAGGGSTATGWCIFDARATENRGLCSFWAGTGSLAGFTAILDVTVDDTGLWHLDGTYYGTVTDVPPAPTASSPVPGNRAY